MKLEKTLKQIRLEKELKQKDAAVLIGLSQTYLSQIESGAKDVSMQSLDKICKAYKIPKPAVLLRAMDESDVDESKREIFKSIKPALVNLIKSIY